MTLKIAVDSFLSPLKPIAILWMVTVPVVSSAHHSFNFYAFGGLLEVEGELVDVVWRNPHVYFTVKTTNEEGQEELWKLQGATLYTIQRRGVTRDLFETGTQIKAAGRKHAKFMEMWVHNIQLADGREVIINRGSEPRWNFDAIGWARSEEARDKIVDVAAEDRGLFRVWSEPGERPIAPQAQMLLYWEEPPPSTAEWLAVLDDYYGRCEPMGMPETVGTPLPFELIDHGATVGMLINGANDLYERTFHITDQEDPAEQTPSPFGYSVGHWEDDNTLVVETTRVRYNFPSPAHLPQTEDVKFDERFTLSEDQSQLIYELTVTDPEVIRIPAAIIAKTYLALGETVPLPMNCLD